jgi:hypothetical protein
VTAQFTDSFQIDGEKHTIAGVSGKTLFDVKTLGLRLIAGSSACWRGHVAIFGLAQDRLVVADLYANIGSIDQAGKLSFEPGIAPPIHGVNAKRTGRNEQSYSCNHVYRQLNLPLTYSGGILLGTGFIRDLYVHIGFAPAWKYTKVLELIFSEGKLSGRHDRSEACRIFREGVLRDWENWKMQPGPPREDPGQTEEKAKKWIERAFDQTYTPFPG